MKLYTEEQVLKIIQKTKMDNPETYYEILQYYKPIELPSDEEIKSYSNRYSTIHEDVSDKLGQYLVSAIHIDGAKWLKEQILNQNNNL